MNIHYFKLLILLTLFSACQQNQKSKDGQPLRNVLFIVGDDHAFTTLGCYGNPKIQTPNLDNLASEGVLFTRAYANAPMCSASRQSMLTGKYPHATGVTLLRTSFPDENITMAEHLKTFGFKTGIIGKDHFNNNLNHGFDLKIGRRDWLEQVNSTMPDSIEVLPKWKPFQDPASVWLNSGTLPAPYYDEDMSGTYYTKKTLEFIEQNKENRFFLWLAFHEPHSPFYFPIEDTEKYRSTSMEVPEMSVEDEQWMPAIFKDLNEEEKEGIIKSYYTSVTHMDKNAGMVLDKLKELGLDDQTLVVYLGDHGYLLGDHGRFEKHMMWEEAIRTPLIIKVGNSNIEPVRSDALTELIDLAATVMDAVQVDAMTESQGSSLWPVLMQETSHHKDTVFAEFLADNKAMVSTKEWKYIYSTGQRDLAQGYATGNLPMGVTHRLYNLVDDQGETHDVSSHPQNQEILKKLQNSMIATFKRTHLKADNLPEDLSTEEILSWFCEPPDKGAELDAR